MSTMIQAGMFDLGGPGPPETEFGDLSRFHRVTFPTPFPPGSRVIVIPMVQTFNGPDSPAVRIGAVDETGFCFRINEIVVHDPNAHALSDGHHLVETIGWVAMTAFKLPTPRKLCKDVKKKSRGAKKRKKSS